MVTPATSRTGAFRLMRANTFAVVALIGLHMLYAELTDRGDARWWAVVWLVPAAVALGAAVLARRQGELDVDYPRLANVGPGLTLLLTAMFSTAYLQYLPAAATAVVTILLNWSTARAVRRGGRT